MLAIAVVVLLSFIIYYYRSRKLEVGIQYERAVSSAEYGVQFLICQAIFSIVVAYVPVVYSAVTGQFNPWIERINPLLYPFEPSQAQLLIVLVSPLVSAFLAHRKVVRPLREPEAPSSKWFDVTVCLSMLPIIFTFYLSLLFNLYFIYIHEIILPNKLTFDAIFILDTLGRVLLLFFPFLLVGIFALEKSKRDYNRSAEKLGLYEVQKRHFSIKTLLLGVLLAISGAGVLACGIHNTFTTEEMYTYTFDVPTGGSFEYEDKEYNLVGYFSVDVSEGDSVDIEVSRLIEAYQGPSYTVTLFESYETGSDCETCFVCPYELPLTLRLCNPPSGKLSIKVGVDMSLDEMQKEGLYGRWDCSSTLIHYQQGSTLYQITGLLVTGIGAVTSIFAVEKPTTLLMLLKRKDLVCK